VAEDLYVGARFEDPKYGVWAVVYVWPATKTRGERYTIRRENDPCVPASTTKVSARFLAGLKRVSDGEQVESEGASG
jgi:hypothetical protein